MRPYSLVLSIPAVTLCCLSTARAQEAYDIVLRGGRLLDPRNGVDGVMDVGVRAGRIAKIAPALPPRSSQRDVDVEGLYVTPGLVDVHVHVYAGTGAKDVYAGDRSLYPDGHSFRGGVTTMVDAGSSGWRNFEDFKQRVIDRSRTRVLAWVNIVGGGMGDVASQQVHEEMRPERVAELARRYPDLIVGVKTAHHSGPEWIAVERAVEAGRLAGIPVMVDFGTFREERPFQQLVLEKLRPGDVYTHLYHGSVPLLDRAGKLLPYLFEARKRGVKFDVGHGRDSFRWFQAVPAVRQGWLPDTISTDLHAGNMNAGMKDMATTMSKFLSLGVPLADVVRRATQSAAELIHRPELGRLEVGAIADVAVFRLREGDFGFLDARGVLYRGKQRLECELTLFGGEVAWDLNGRAGEEWTDDREAAATGSGRR